MDDIEQIRNKIKYKRNNINSIKQEIFESVKFKKIVSKILITIILFLGLNITLKLYPESKDIIYKNAFEKNFSFATINKIYNKYFGDVLPVKKIFKEETTPVFKENLIFDKKESYKDGVVLSVTDNYLVPIIESGMVVYIGEKEEFGNTVIIQQINGIDTWYGNINTTDVKLYQYVEKGTLLGETSKKLYLLFKKDGVVQDYNEYVK